MVLIGLFMLFSPLVARTDSHQTYAQSVKAVLGAGGLSAEQVRVQRVRVTDKYRNPYEMPDPYIADTRVFRDASTVPSKVAFDAKLRRLTQEYAWGSLKVDYATTDSRLDMKIVVSNTSSDVIEEIALDMLSLTLPEDATTSFAYTSAGQGPNRGFNIGEPMLLTAQAKADPMVVVCSPQPDRPLAMRLTKNSVGSFTLSATVGDERQTEIYDRIWNVRPIKPKSSETVLISVRFGTQDSDPYDLASDVCRAFSKARPMVLNWPDRRPILGVMPSKGGGADWKINPRGWWEIGDKSIYTPEGKENFKKFVNGFTDAVITSAQQSGAQGVIFWNIEGGQWFWHAFYGAPELTKYLAPEMDEVADQMCKKLRDAGLRVGFCIRPTEIFPIVKTANGDEKKELQSWDGVDERQLGELKPYYGDMPVKEGTPVDDARIERSPVARLNDKINYAQKRWGATLFYIDSNGYDRPVQKRDQKNGKPTQWRTLSAEEWQKLSRLHPDVLLIPEHEYAEYWSATAPYQQPPKYGGMTRHDIHSIYPEAFSTIALFGGMEGQVDIEQHMQEYTSALQNGDLILYAGWMPPPQPLLDVYKRAADLAPIKVQISKDGKYTLQGKPIANASEFKLKVSAMVKNKPVAERRVIVLFDRSLDKKSIAGIVNKIGEAGAIIAWTEPLP